ncbi:allantoinase AllB [Nocardiopsis rhodophaea]|uniref:Allantoinase AllB n=1 Tax=Nocardiopsis rhodophaea TaxID=280238 RepID=A0ABN2SHZ5_9ACTN
MPQIDTVIRSRRVATPDGVEAAAVGISSGRIAALLAYNASVPDARHEIDLGPVALLPGCVDLDVAVQAPGQPLREGYQHTTAAAVRAGVTSIVVTPAPGRPAITSVSALKTHMAAAADAEVNVAFLGGITPRSTPADLADLRGAGVAGFHCSLSDGGAPDISAVDEPLLRKTMAEVGAMDAPVIVHAEDAGELAVASRSHDVDDGLPAARPPRAERRGLERVIAAARVTGTRTHISPFTAAECAALLAAARALGVAVSAQTCPHYLCLPAETVPADSPAFRCRPPLRSGANRNALWSALLADGDSAISTIGSGHRPGTGVAAIPWTLPALWTAASRRGRGLDDLVRWTASGPAEVAGMRWKGQISAGYDADLLAFDPDAEQTVPDTDVGPYAGRLLSGRVKRTWVAGRAVFPRPLPRPNSRRDGQDGSALHVNT